MQILHDNIAFVYISRFEVELLRKSRTVLHVCDDITIIYIFPLFLMQLLLSCKFSLYICTLF